ncbi:MAG: putative glycoside hydrolase [Oscillospiraceae bacterium]|jgi:hypothetical protein|nr:putative glycoside hydrolase [Oscillospiraceae bacterium]
MPRYKTYHGRKKLRWLKVSLLCLLAGGVVALCAFVLPDYVTWSEDGLTIDLPFMSWMTRKAPSEPPPPQDSVVVEVPPPPSPSPEPSPSPSPTPRRTPGQVRAFFLPLTLLGDTGELETIRRRALEDGVNMLALEYKDARGTVVNEAILAAALEILSVPGLTLTAVVAACVDNTVPFGPNAEWAVKHISGVNFKDNFDRRWLNPYLPEVRAFIIGQVLAAYEAGFDRVMLTHVGFPYSGGVNQIDYNGEELTVGPVNAVNILLDGLRDAASERPLDVWLFESTANEGVFETAGQDLAAFGEAFDLMFVTLPDDVTSIERPFIPIIPNDGGDITHKLELAEQGFMLYNGLGKYYDS